MKKLVLFFLITIIYFNLLSNPILAINNDPTTYPYKNSIKGQVDKWGFYTRNCTSYSAYKVSQSVGNFHNTMTGPNGKSGTFSNANNWDNNAQNIGFTVTSSPSQGSIVVWEAYKGGAGSVGHVAYIEKVNTNGSINLSEYNWNYGDGNYNERSNVQAIDGRSFITFNTSSSCNPPSQGNWVISGNKQCVLEQNKTMTGNIIISDTSTLTLKNSTKLSIDLNKYKIEINDNAKLFIKDSAKIN